MCSENPSNHKTRSMTKIVQSTRDLHEPPRTWKYTFRARGNYLEPLGTVRGQLIV